jgi:hypothetical protein
MCAAAFAQTTTTPPFSTPVMDMQIKGEGVALPTGVARP